MTREQAAEIIRREYLCVDRDCDIDRSCGKCDLMIPSKEPILEAYKMAIQALQAQADGDYISRQAVLDLLEDTNNGWIINEVSRLPSVKPQERTGYISIDDAMSVFDDFMCGEVDEDGTDTFLEMLKDRVERSEE